MLTRPWREFKLLVLMGTWTSRPFLLSTVTESLGWPLLLTSTLTGFDFLSVYSEIWSFGFEIVEFLGTLTCSNFVSFSIIFSWLTLMASISLGSMDNTFDTCFFNFKSLFLYSIITSDLWPVVSFIKSGSTPSWKAL